MTACVGLVDRDCVYGKRIHTDGVTKKGDPKNYQDRLRTFRLDPQPWPLLCPSPEDLAKAGFIYTGQGTRVNCPSCGIYVEDWSDSTVDPVRKHYTRNTRCGFLHTHHAQRVHDFSIDSQYSGASLRLNDTSMRLNDTSMRLPDYSATEVRLSSFKNWTKDVIGSKEELAEAGLYLVEQPDVLRCYACRVELKDWVPGDTAVGKHLKKSPHCSVAGQQLSLGYTPRVSIYPLDTTPNLSVPTSDLQKQRPLASEGRLYTNPSDLSRRHSDRSVYLSPSYTVSAPPHFAHANSYEPMAQATPQWTGSVLCSGDIRTDSPSPRWMLDAGVDIRLPPSLDVKRRSTQSYTVGPPTSTLRNTVTPASTPPIVPTPLLTTPPSPPHHSAMSPSAMAGRIVGGGSALDDSKLCQICFENPLGMVFIPCGHVCTCESCAGKVSNCPLCRRPIEQSFRFFLP